MLTPQEAEAHVFPKASFGGYNMVQVDSFLDSLIEDYRTLYQENIALKNKMKVLVDKVEEYRATEDAMRLTLHSAQKMAEAMVKEGEEKKQAAIDQAVSAAQTASQQAQEELRQQELVLQGQVESTQKHLADEQVRLDAARAATTAYIAQLKELYTNQLQYIGGLSKLTADASVPPAEEETPPAEEKTAPPAAEAAAPQPEAAKLIKEPGEGAGDLGDTRVFDTLQYGKDYNLE